MNRPYKRLVPYKFEIVAICHVIDEGDYIVAEQPVARQTEDGRLEPVVVFGLIGLTNWVHSFQEQLDQINDEMPGRQPRPTEPDRPPSSLESLT